MKYSILLLIVAFSCTAQQNGQQNNEDSQAVITSTEAMGLLEKNCYACHNPNTKSHDEILAPPLAGIKQRYLNASSDREEFINKMSAFVQQPSDSIALMKWPVKRFGVMPKPVVSPEEINAIVQYIHDNEIPEPAWHKDHHQKQKSGNR